MAIVIGQHHGAEPEARTVLGRRGKRDHRRVTQAREVIVDQQDIDRAVLERAYLIPPDRWRQVGRQGHSESDRHGRSLASAWSIADPDWRRLTSRCAITDEPLEGRPQPLARGLGLKEHRDAVIRTVV